MIYYPAPPGYTPPPQSPQTAAYINESEEPLARERASGQSTWGSMKGCWKDSPLFADKDGVEFQREMRDEWDD